jgi:hypothetical protein
MKTKTPFLSHFVDMNWVRKTSSSQLLRSLTYFLRNLGQKIIVYLSQGKELRVWQSCDRQGHVWWNVADPITGKSAQLLSEAEVCIWIEQHY